MGFVKEAIALAAEGLSLLWVFKKYLTRLEGSLTMGQAFLRDVDKRQPDDEVIKAWLQRLEGVAYDANLDEFNYEILPHKIQIGNQMERKVCFFFFLSNPILFRSKMAHKTRELNTNLKVIVEERRDFGLQTRLAFADVPQVLTLLAVTGNRETDSFNTASNFMGREGDRPKIAELLVASNDDTISVIAILGMDGIGKTTSTQWNVAFSLKIIA